MQRNSVFDRARTDAPKSVFSIITSLFLHPSVSRAFCASECKRGYSVMVATYIPFVKTAFGGAIRSLENEHRKSTNAKNALPDSELTPIETAVTMPAAAHRMAIVSERRRSFISIFSFSFAVCSARRRCDNKKSVALATLSNLNFFLYAFVFSIERITAKAKSPIGRA